jgi:hypothetical protein
MGASIEKHPGEVEEVREVEDAPEAGCRSSVESKDERFNTEAVEGGGTEVTEKLQRPQ